jgi:predicted DCC family thiol-disulfide oxidoreductase YuxK
MKPRILPDPDQRPNADVVIYDGQCRICTGQIRTLARLDLTRQLSFLSLHDRRARDRYPDLSFTELMKQMYVVDRRMLRHGGALAVRHLSRRMPALWPLAPLLHLPGTLPFWRWLYREIAQRRYRLGQTQCTEGTCHLH